MLNEISAFEYISILVSIILGLGITQILTSFSDLLYHSRRVKMYWPHVAWTIFILFLHIQDWFVTYQLKHLQAWPLPLLLFILAYPIALFITAKMLFPQEGEGPSFALKDYYYEKFPLIFILVIVCIILSISFNIYLLHARWTEQILLFLFLFVLSWIVIGKVKNQTIHRSLALLLMLGMIISIILEKNVWIVQ
jgi:hypothetical protein